MSAVTAAGTAEVRTDPLVRTARTTGLLYLGLALTGLVGFLLIRPRLSVAGDPSATLARLAENEQLARVGIAFELGIVVTQALAALWFYRLFRTADPFAAGAIAAFGLVNAVAVLGGVAFLATALEIALEPAGDSAGDSAGDVATMLLAGENLWGVGALFFGLWLIPMGTCVLTSGWMPRPLGWILVAGGVGYVLSAFVRYLAPDAGVLVDLLAVPASVGEFWMVGYLLVRGVARDAAPRPPVATV
jgi:hypothetical protein